MSISSFLLFFLTAFSFQAYQAPFVSQSAELCSLSGEDFFDVNPWFGKLHSCVEDFVITWDLKQNPLQRSCEIEFLGLQYIGKKHFDACLPEFVEHLTKLAKKQDSKCLHAIFWALSCCFAKMEQLALKYFVPLTSQEVDSGLISDEHDLYMFYDVLYIQTFIMWVGVWIYQNSPLINLEQDAELHALIDSAAQIMQKTVGGLKKNFWQMAYSLCSDQTTKLFLKKQQEILSVHTRDRLNKLGDKLSKKREYLRLLTKLDLAHCLFLQMTLDQTFDVEDELGQCIGDLKKGLLVLDPYSFGLSMSAFFSILMQVMLFDTYFSEKWDGAFFDTIVNQRLIDKMTHSSKNTRVKLWSQFVHLAANTKFMFPAMQIILPTPVFVQWQEGVLASVRKLFKRVIPDFEPALHINSFDLDFCRMAWILQDN